MCSNMRVAIKQTTNRYDTKSLGGTKCNDILWSPASLKCRRIVKSITISPRAHGLKKMTKNTRLTNFRIRKVPCTTIPIWSCSHTGTLTSHHFPIFLHNQIWWTKNIQILLTRHHITTSTTTFWCHCYWNIKSINQRYIVVMQSGFACSKCHFH